MGASAVLLAKRAFVKALLALAAAVGVAAGVKRESPDPEVMTAGRRVAEHLRAGAGAGGGCADEQRAGELEALRAAWNLARKTKGTPGRPASGNARGSDLHRGRYRIQATAAMLTYSGFKDALQWQRFIAAMTDAQLQAWGVKHWCATLERCTKTSGALHVHLSLQFRKQVQDRSSRAFAFECIAPRMDQNDLCGEGLCGRKMQESIDRGFFYVFANKLGTVLDDVGAPCVAGNYMPCWTSASLAYPVLGKWTEKLWKRRKLSRDQYEEYLFLTRDGRRGPGAEAELGRSQGEGRRSGRERGDGEDRQALARYVTLSSSSRFLSCQQHKLGATCLTRTASGTLCSLSSAARQRVRRNGQSPCSGTPIEVKVGALEFFPDGVSAFRRHVNDGLVLDDVRDLSFFVERQEKLQGKYDARVESASTQGGTCRYTKYLFAVPVAVTINFSTRNLGFPETSDWLKNPANRVLIKWPLA